MKLTNSVIVEVTLYNVYINVYNSCVCIYIYILGKYYVLVKFKDIVSPLSIFCSVPITVASVTHEGLRIALEFDLMR